MATPIVTDLSVADAWWRREDPARTLRFDLAAFPNCGSTLGRLDLARVPLQRPSSAYAPLNGRFQLIANDLFGPPFAFSHRHKKYLVYGHGGSWFDLQDSGWLAHLDAPQFALTVSTAGSTGHGRVDSDLPGIDCPPACSVPWDSGTPVTLTATAGDGTRFAGWSGDCSGTSACSLRMDAARSVAARFAVQVRLSVTVVRRGGAGSIVSAPPGLECSAACSAVFDSGQVVRLTAAPDPGSRFLGWSGACTGRGACSLTADAEKAVTAAFGRATYRLSVRVSGGGRVTSRPAGISCGRRCSASFRADSSVRLRATRLRATPAAGWGFSGWAGACRGRGACVVRATADRSVRATFRR